MDGADMGSIASKGSHASNGKGSSSSSDSSKANSSKKAKTADAEVKPAKVKVKSMVKTEGKSVGCGAGTGAASVAGGETDGKAKPKGGYNKECRLTAALAELLGCPEIIARPAVVKKMWEYIRAQSLQNPADKREILLDAPLRAIFNVDSFTMFSMNKYLTEHISPL